MATYTIEPERRTLHGKFSRDFPPVLTIDSGDTVVYRTLDAGWNLEQPVTRLGTHKKFEPRDPARDFGHALCGPIAIQNARPGMTLEIQINEIRPGRWGWTFTDGWDRLNVGEMDDHMAWTLNAESMTGSNKYGHTLALHPFMGVMGMPPNEAGIHDTGPPRFCGGNLDCKELVAGSTLYLPIAVAGALFSVGDGHAVQGDGEVCITALETGVTGTFRLTVRKDMELSWPFAESATHLMSIGLDEDLDDAAKQAVREMVKHVCARTNLTRNEAYMLCSLAGNLRVTQLVDGNKGIHMLLPKSHL